MTAVAAGEVDTYRNLEPKSMIEETKRLIEARLPLRHAFCYQ